MNSHSTPSFFESQADKLHISLAQLPLSRSQRARPSTRRGFICCCRRLTWPITLGKRHRRQVVPLDPDARLFILLAFQFLADFGHLVVVGGFWAAKVGLVGGGGVGDV